MAHEASNLEENHLSSPSSSIASSVKDELNAGEKNKQEDGTVIEDSKNGVLIENHSSPPSSQQETKSSDETEVRSRGENAPESNTNQHEKNKPEEGVIIEENKNGVLIENDSCSSLPDGHENKSSDEIEKNSRGDISAESNTNENEESKPKDGVVVEENRNGVLIENNPFSSSPMEEQENKSSDEIEKNSRGEISLESNTNENEKNKPEDGVVVEENRNGVLIESNPFSSSPLEEQENKLSDEIDITPRGEMSSEEIEKNKTIEKENENKSSNELQKSEPEMDVVVEVKKDEVVREDNPPVKEIETNEIQSSESKSNDTNVVEEKKDEEVVVEDEHLSHLKETEKKALIDLKSKMEEAINEKIEEKNEVNEKEKEDEKSVEEEKSEEKAKEVLITDKLWGVTLLPSKGEKATDIILLKFLRATDYKVNEAFEMLRNTLKWRKEHNIDAILNENFGNDLNCTAYMSGHDRERQPVCYNVFGVLDDEKMFNRILETEENRDRFLKWRVQLMEKGIQNLDFRPGGCSSLLQINDLKNTPLPSKKELRLGIKHAVSVLQDNYPEFVYKNIFINVPFWYYAFITILSPFLTQRTNSKIVFARSSKVAEVLLKYVAAEELPIQYGGLKQENDADFSVEDKAVEVFVKSGSTETIEISASEVDTTLMWDLTVLGWEVNYKEEFVPVDDKSYTIIVKKVKRIGLQEKPLRNSFKVSEPGKIVITIENAAFKKKRVLYRHKTSNNSATSE